MYSRSYGVNSSCSIAISICGFFFTTGKADEEKYQYNNVDTGYEAVIEDDADIIDESNYSSLLDIMKQITVYGNVMLKTIDTNSTTTEKLCKKPVQGKIWH